MYIERTLFLKLVIGHFCFYHVFSVSDRRDWFLYINAYLII